MELVRPSAKYKRSFLEALPEYDVKDPSQRYARLDGEAMGDFDHFVREETEKSEGKHLPEGFVPETVWWLVDQGEYIGRVSIRHELTPYLLKVGGHIGYDIRPSKRGQGYGSMILQLALPKAKELGIDKVLVTCDETNKPSRKIIEKAGGVLEDKQPTESGVAKLRYWIAL